MAHANSCKIPMRDFVSMDYDFAVNDCMGIWAAPLWMTPDKWQWGAGSGEIDAQEACPRDDIYLNFAGGGHQVKSQFGLERSEGHITVRKDNEGIVTITSCSTSEAIANGNQCSAPQYSNCQECLNGSNRYACWCNDGSNPKHIYGSGGCQNGGNCQWTLVSDIWNGVRGDEGYFHCMSAVPEIGLEARQPHRNSNCAISVQNIKLRGGGPNGSLQWGPGSPASCSVLSA